MNPRQLRAFLLLSLLCVMMAAACYLAGCDHPFDTCKAHGGKITARARDHCEHSNLDEPAHCVTIYDLTCTPPDEATP